MSALLYMQDVLNLYEFSELWGAGESDMLARHRFVARPGEEKELFTAYEKIAYARRPVSVTADAALQVFHDELATRLPEAERKAARSVAEMAGTLMKELSEEGEGVDGGYLITCFGVAWAFFTAAEGARWRLDDLRVLPVRSGPEPTEGPRRYDEAAGEGISPNQPASGSIRSSGSITKRIW